MKISSFSETGGNGFIYANEIANLKEFNNGRVWYVVKSNSNCSASGRVGDPTQPFCDPWQARDSAITGDRVIIEDGVWTVGTVGSGAYKESTGSGDVDFSLWRDEADSVVWYWNTGTGLVLYDETDTNFAGTLYWVDGSTGNRAIYITGNGSFDFKNANVGRLFSIRPSANTINAYIECNYLKARWNELFAEYDSRIVKIKTASLGRRQNNNGRFLSYGVPSGLGEPGGKLSIIVENAIMENFNFTDWADVHLFSGYGSYKKDIYIKVNNVSINNKGWGSVFSLGNGTSDSCNINIEIGNLRAEDPFLFSQYGSYTIDETTESTKGNGSPFAINSEFTLGNLFNFNLPGNGNQVSVNIGNLNSDMVINGATRAGFDVVYNISNAYARSNNPLIVDGNDAYGGNNTVYFKVDRCSSAGSPVLEIQRNNRLDLSGRFEVRTNDTPVIAYNAGSLGSNLTKLFNSELITANQAAPIAPITGGNARSYLIQNCFSNALITSPDVTELIEPITRNTNVR